MRWYQLSRILEVYAYKSEFTGKTPQFYTPSTPVITLRITTNSHEAHSIFVTLYKQCIEILQRIREQTKSLCQNMYRMHQDHSGQWCHYQIRREMRSKTR